MAGEQVPWPNPPREPGPWGGGPPVAPPGNTPLPPLPGASGVMDTGSATANPWSSTGPAQPLAVPGGPAPFPGLPPGAGGRRDRAPGWLLGVAVVVVLALVGGVGYLVWKDREASAYPSEWDERVAPIAAWVAKARGLEFDHPVDVLFLSEKEYTEASGGGDPVTEGGAEDEADEEGEQASADSLGQLRALGLLSGEPDLEAAGRALSDSGTLAFYSPTTEKVYVRGTELTPGLRVTLAHELTHVLQDQQFDLGRLADMPSSEATVFRALAEGDATRIEERYVEDVLTDEEMAEYLEQSAAEGAEATEALAAEVPPILTTFFSSPYLLGPRLVSYLDLAGNSDIDDALTEVPSEEVLFDPLTYGKTSAVPTKAVVDPPEGIEEDDRDEFGPTALYLVLATRLDPNVALRATDGWGGDEYVQYRQDDRVCLRAAFRSDTEADATELRDALATWVSASPATASIEEEEDQVVLQTCDPGKDAPAIGDQDNTSFLLLPISRVDLYLARKEQAKDTTDQAECFAQTFIDQVTLPQLLDGGFLESIPGQELITSVGLACR